MKTLVLGIALLGSFIGTILAGDMRCYVCSSYMEQCKTYVDTTKGYAHRGRCYSKCFTRLGEDGAIYRGCFDGFKEVPFLTSKYDGCKNQTWNGQSLPWCFCDGDLCNKASMADMGYGSNLDLQGGYRVEGHYHKGFQGAAQNYNGDQSQYAAGDDGNYVQQNGAVVAVDNTVHQQSGYAGTGSQQQAGYASDSSAYAKEGVVNGNGFGIQEGNTATGAASGSNQNQINDKYTQNYYSQNGYMPSYYGDFDKFHYTYQVEDPNTYVEETSPDKYIAMDESEGFKSNIEPEDDAAKDTMKDEKDTKVDASDAKAATGADIGKKEVNESDDIYSKTDYVYNSVPYMAPAYAMQPPSVYAARPQTVQQPLSFFPPYPKQQPQYAQGNTGLNENFKNQEVETKPEEDPYFFPPHLAERIECAKTGFYQNPDDCRTFVACILDAHVRRPYMHLMRCPEGLVWDNTDKICNQFSTTCNVGGYVEGTYDIQAEEVQIQPDQQPANVPVYEEPNVQQQQEQLKHDFIKYAGE